MTMGADNLSGAVAPDRFAGQLAYRELAAGQSVGELPTPAGQRGGIARRESEPDGGSASHNGDGAVRASLADLNALAEPVFSTGWLESTSGGGALADHPLLRGLLLELPPKGTAPAPGWLDRWFEAARSILELLYVQDAQRR